MKMVFALVLLVGMMSLAHRIQPSVPGLDISIFHRRNAQTLMEWERVASGDSLHYLQHGQVPFFRMYQARIPRENTEQWSFGEVTLRSYLTDSLVREVSWDGNRPVATTRDIQKMNRYTSGLLEAVDYEVLELQLYYRESPNEAWQPWAKEPFRFVVVLDQ
ncbi:MAG TPA: hypothetical protein DCE41_36585 [Cytophagales bacterium]|nr:hypothetical protein [Cytophagales bacterium]HAA18371.1 hypothetical protein [Cytophagales bacterium]HAP61418.1 hypothetical protein [Cytophagales bacterium]